MPKLILSILILSMLIYFFFIRKSRKRYIEPPSPATWYKSIPSLFTPAEQHFLTSLEMALEGISIRIFGKTRIADLIRVRPGMSRNDYSAAFNKIRSKHVDFVLVDPHSFMPLLIIELDDSSHERQDRKLRDAFVDEAMIQAGLPILHIPLRKRYAEIELRNEILTILESYRE